MPNLSVVLGQERLAEADQSALPALRSLCRALGVHTHWDDTSCTLYIASPFVGKHLVIDAATCEAPAFEQVALRIAASLRNQVEGAGGQVTVVRGPSDLRNCDLLLSLSVGNQRAWGVGAAYRWLSGDGCRNAAALLSGAVAEAAGVPHLGARLSLVGGRQAGVPSVELQIGRPDEASLLRVHSEEFTARVADGLYQGLARFWAAPAAPVAPVPPAPADEPAVPAMPPTAFPSPEELGIPVEYVQQVAESSEEPPRLVLLPEWSASADLAVQPKEQPEPDPEPDPEPVPEPHAEPEPQFVPPPEPEAAAPVVAPPPEPAPTPEPRLVLTNRPGNPIPFKFQPFSDPRMVPGASRVLVFQREAPAPPPPPAAPPPRQAEAVPSALEEFFRQPEPEPPAPAPAPVLEELVSLKAAPMLKKKPERRQVRVIQ